MDATMTERSNSPALPARAEGVSLSCIIPCRDEAKNLELLLPRLRKVLESLGVPWEVVLVDDGSRDTTASLGAAWAREPGFRLLQLSRNFGKEAAITAGLEAA